MTNCLDDQVSLVWRDMRQEHPRTPVEMSVETLCVSLAVAGMVADGCEVTYPDLFVGGEQMAEIAACDDALHRYTQSSLVSVDSVGDAAPVCASASNDRPELINDTPPQAHNAANLRLLITKRPLTNPNTSDALQMAKHSRLKLPRRHVINFNGRREHWHP